MTSPSVPPPTAAPIEALQLTLAAEHAAVYAYAVIGVHLPDTGEVDRARSRQSAHRASRDALAAQLVSLGATPVAAAPLYRPGGAVDDETTAHRWAVTVEAACAVGYRYQLRAALQAGPGGPTRASALAGLADAARAGSYWRARLTPDTPTTPFPGVA